MKNKFIRYFLFSILVTMVFIIERGEMFKGGVDDGESFAALNYIIVFMLAISGIVVFSNYGSLISSQLSRRFLYANIIVYVLTIVWSFIYPLPSRNVLGYAILPIMMFYYTMLVTRYETSNRLLITTMSLMALLLVYHFFTNYFSMNLEIKNRSTSSYTILYLLPFTLCSKKKIVRMAAIAITLFVIVFSLKLGGLIGASLGVSTYLLLYQTVIKGKRFKIGGWLVIIGAIFIIAWIISQLNYLYMDELLTVRVLEAQESGGSGRMDIYSDVLKLIANSSLLNFLFGHGWGATIKDSRMHLTAHNDFLEVFYDFGFFSFVLYILLIIALLKFCHKLLKQKSEYAPALGASIAIFLVGSSFSHIWIYYNNLLLFAIFWGFICANEYKKYYR